VRFLRARTAYLAVARAAPTFLLLALVVFGGWLAARWAVYLVTPAEAPGERPQERLGLSAAGQGLADGHLFGVASSVRGEAVTDLNVKLKGVFAGGDSGVAILNTGGKDEATRVGGELVPGVVLESVHERHVMLNRNGARERVNLEERISARVQVAAVPRLLQSSPQTAFVAPGSSAPGVAPRRSPGAGFQRPEPYAPVSDVATSAPVPAPPADAPLPSSVSPAPGAASPPQPIATSSAEGVVIQSVPPGSMLARLGLQPGDVVRSVNGERVTSEADVARVLQQRGLQGSFSAEVQRGGMVVPIAVGGQ
jgi:general secretion pathway protein C